MKNTIKFAALGAVALAASSTAALADSQLLPGITAGLALGAPLPEGVYDISIGAVQQRVPAGGVEAGLPVWLIWSTPYQIAGGRIGFDGTIAWVNLDTQISPVGGVDGFQNGLTEATIKWNLQNGFNFGLGAGVWWVGSGSDLADNKNSRFMGQADVAYIHGGWQFTANTFYGEGDKSAGNTALTAAAPDYFNYDLAAVRAFGKAQFGVVAYGSEDLNSPVRGWAKQSQFAVGGLVGYDFGSFSANFKLTQVVAEENYGYKDTTAWLTIVKPLWSPAAEGPLK